MHELSIAKNILTIAAGEWTSRNLEHEITQITVKIGKLNQVIPDALRFNFDIAKKDYPVMKDATLNIVDIPIRVRCKSCATTAELLEPVFSCQNCGEAVSVESGDEMWIDSISIGDS